METLSAPRQTRFGLTGNMLKIIAAIAMTLDHIGLILFPRITVLRLIGRIAMPIFSYMIAQGCHYTRNKLRYFLGVFLLGVVCQSVYVIASGDWYLCMPISFAISIALVFALQKAAAGSKLFYLAFAVGVAALYGLTQVMHLDYGFWGCMMAVFASVPMLFKKADRRWSVLALGVGMLPLAFSMGAWQFWSFLAIPLLLLYNGQRGKWKMKYFFYIFYPTHLALLQGIAWLRVMLR